jgi:uncharacterized membrane protein
MVTSRVGEAASSIEFIVLPNRSLNWKAARAAFFVFVGFTAAIAACFVTQGAWLVLPFAGLELLAVGAGLYLCALRTHSREIIRVERDAIVVQRGRNRPDSELRIPRAWARVVLSRDRNGWYPSRLLIRSHGNDTEVGTQLVEGERLKLAEQLGHVVGINATRPGSPWTHPARQPVASTRLPAGPATG